MAVLGRGSRDQSRRQCPLTASACAPIARPHGEGGQGLWTGAASLPTPKCDYLRLALLLPLRRQELADTRRGDIRVNGDRMEIVIASHRSKNRNEHRVPLVGEARQIVERLLDVKGAPDDFLIRLSEDGTPMNSWRRFAEAIERASGVSFQFHDTNVCSPARAANTISPTTP